MSSRNRPMEFDKPLADRSDEELRQDVRTLEGLLGDNPGYFAKSQAGRLLSFVQAEIRARLDSKHESLLSTVKRGSEEALTYECSNE